MTRSKMLTLHQVAEILGLHYKTVCDLRAGGDLPASNVSGGVGTGVRWRVSEADLDRFIESRRSAA